MADEALANNSKAEKSAEAAKPAARKQWSPRIWSGMNFPTWMGVLFRNRWNVSLRYTYKLILITTCTVANSVLWLVEKAVYGRAVAKTQIHPQPLIILGHWRSGTTWLHELFGLDPQFSSPSTYQCLAPTQFLVSGWAKWLLGFLVPEHRPMDNMPVGWDRPQEDEFAMCNLGAKSPYMTIAFPNRGFVYEEYLTFVGVPHAERERWKQTLLGFLRKVTFATKKRLIIKSPGHTARVDMMLEMFPDAKFVHIVRDPYVLFPSTVHLWKRLYDTHGMQEPTYEGVEEHVLERFVRIDDKFDQDRSRIPPGNLISLRYEDLVKNPIPLLRQIYEQLELGDFEQVRPAVEKYLSEQADYKTNKYRLTPEQRAEVTRRWSRYFDRYGYPRDPQSAADASTTSPIAQG